jgi:prepilin-type processing-associated H-X9-DG protein
LKLDSQHHQSEVFLVADSAQDPADGNNVASTGYRVMGWRASDTSVYRWFVAGVDDVDTTPVFSANEDATTSKGDFRFRHAAQSVCNMAFLDGHAASMQQDSLTRRNILPDAP